MFRILRKLGDLTDRPAQGFAQHRSASFADGRQPLQIPFLRTVLPQLSHEQAVRQLIGVKSWQETRKFAANQRAVPDVSML